MSPLGAPGTLSPALGGDRVFFGPPGMLLFGRVGFGGLIMFLGGEIAGFGSGATFIVAFSGCAGLVGALDGCWIGLEGAIPDLQGSGRDWENTVSHASKNSSSGKSSIK